MADIGTTVCSRVSGSARLMSEEMDRWKVPGIDGIGIHYLGKRGQATSVRAVFYGLTVNMQPWYDSLINQIGQIVTVVNDQGTNYPNQLILSVGEVQMQAVQAVPFYQERWECDVTIETVVNP